MSRIALVEPFYRASHKSWADGLISHSSHQIQLFSLPGRHWKWRMEGAAIELAKEVNQYSEQIDLILCSDFLDVALFKSLLKPELNPSPIYLYFHENQLTYPWSSTDEDVKLKRDAHYAFKNYTSALIADKVFFNSEYHKQSFLTELPQFLNRFPDYKNLETVEEIIKKSQVLYLGLELPVLESRIEENTFPILLWNHRWEYDKSPDSFKRLVIRLKEKQIDFQLILLGERFKETNAIIQEIVEITGQENVLFNGYADTKEMYWKWLKKADILPVTNKQEFFGISVMEAIHAGVKPVLPNRLSYPELYSEADFYETEEELCQYVIELCKSEYRKKNDVNLNLFKWRKQIFQYDEVLRQ